MSESAVHDSRLTAPRTAARARLSALAGVRTALATTPRLTWTAGVVVAASLGVWTISAKSLDLDAMTDLGLISVLSPLMLAALLAVTTSFCVALHRGVSTPLLVLHLLVLIFMLYGAPTLAEDVPRFAVTWRHLGVTESIARTHTIDPTIDAYFNWPGFFTLSAFVSDAAGVDLRDLAAWAPVFFNVLYLGPLFLVFRQASDDARVVWLALLFFYLGNWIGQDYFSPQGLNVFLYLVVVLIVLRWFPARARFRVRAAVARLSRIRRDRRRAGPPDASGAQRRAAPGTPLERAGAMAILLAVFLTAVSSHQLTPFAILLGVGSLVVVGRCSLTRLPLAMVVLIGAWSAFLSVAYFKGHIASLTGNVGALEQNVGGSVGGRLHGSFEHLLVLYARLALTATIWGLAILGSVRALLRRRLPVAFVALAFAPFALLGLQPYGGEILLRSYLFSLPFMAFLAASLFAGIRRPSWLPIVLTSVLASALGAGLLVTRYGNERMDFFTPSEVEAVAYVNRTARPGSLLLSMASSLPWKFENYEQFDYRTLDGTPAWQQIDPDHPDVAALARHVEREIKRPSGGYFILTRSQKAQLQMLGWSEPFLARFERALRTADGLQVVYANSDAAVFVADAKRRRGPAVTP